MINLNAEFYQGSNGELFRLIRTPQKIIGHIIYLAPLFEQANQTRHMQTRLALNAYKLDVQSIVFDHYGSGDSQGELTQASLAVWQQDIIEQINTLKVDSSKPIFISGILSSVLLLNNEIITAVNGLFLAQPEFNGKRFIQQFKRLAIAGELTNHNKPQTESNKITIAGYTVEQPLLDGLAQQVIGNFSKSSTPCYWLEWSEQAAGLPLARLKQQQAFSAKNKHTHCVCIDDSKFWQSTELEVAPHYIDFEQQALLSLLGNCGVSVKNDVITGAE